MALQSQMFLAMQVFLQQQEIKEKLRAAVEDKNRALCRYRAMRNRFLRKKRRQWKKPGRTSVWSLNVWNGILSDEEWHVNFRMSREFFSDPLLGHTFHRIQIHSGMIQLLLKRS